VDIDLLRVYLRLSFAAIILALHHRRITDRRIRLGDHRSGWQLSSGKKLDWAHFPQRRIGSFHQNMLCPFEYENMLCPFESRTCSVPSSTVLRTCSVPSSTSRPFEYFEYVPSSTSLRVPCSCPLLLAMTSLPIDPSQEPFRPLNPAKFADKTRQTSAQLDKLLISSYYFFSTKLCRTIMG
jgi:hypothetical protein